jgi:hypothetical protein
MDWQNIIKDATERNEMHFKEEAFQEDLANQLEELIDDLQKAIIDGKISLGKLERVFRENKVKIDVMESFAFDDNY